MTHDINLTPQRNRQFKAKPAHRILNRNLNLLVLLPVDPRERQVLLRPRRQPQLERQRQSEWQLGEKDAVRVTPLFRRFIRFAALPSPMNN